MFAEGCDIKLRKRGDKDIYFKWEYRQNIRCVWYFRKCFGDYINICISWHLLKEFEFVVCILVHLPAMFSFAFLFYRKCSNLLCWCALIIHSLLFEKLKRIFSYMEIFNHPRHCYVNVTLPFVYIRTDTNIVYIYSFLCNGAKLVCHLGDAVSWLKTSLYSTYDFW